MSLTLKERLALPVPKMMRTLPRDSRGYPVPWIVMVDRHGTPQFTINDLRKTEAARTKRLCAICGKRMTAFQTWFIGGSRCFLHPRGGFIDGPTHYHCGEYALMVCPFLAARNYARRIDAAKLPVGGMDPGMTLIRQEFMQPRLPERFGFGRAKSFYFQRTGDAQELGVFVVTEWAYVEWWRQGEPCEAPASGRPPPDTDMTT